MGSGPTYGILLFWSRQRIQQEFRLQFLRDVELKHRTFVDLVSISRFSSLQKKKNTVDRQVENR